MQSTTSSSNLGAIGTGIVPPPMHSQQSQYMQSTTPSVANGRDEMRGWLYKWTNVNIFLFFEKPILLFLLSISKVIKNVGLFFMQVYFPIIGHKMK